MKGGIKIDSYKLSKLYEDSLTLEKRKAKGVYYTPKTVVKYILHDLLDKHDIVENPEPKILDLSCGCGNFLIEAFDIIYKLIENNFEKIKNRYGENYIKNISTHIITKCIYGTDIDKDAINILKKTLINKKNYVDKENDISMNINNISCKDGLKKNYHIKFDYIIGNPPYVGHKKLDKDYKKFLLTEYKEVYRDKADLYFCFYKKAISLLKENGKIGFITPRYFLESPSGELLRQYLLKETNIKKIIDLNSINVFEGIGIATSIVFLERKTNNNIVCVYKINKEEQIDKIDNLKSLLQNKNCEKISINQKKLDENWIILNKEEQHIYEKIQNKSQYTLEDICESFQGIITGCDKAFILDINDKRLNHIDEKFLKLWIKNKNIQPYIIEESNQKLIYSNDINDINKYPYINENCFLPYKEKLLNRRECLKNLRKWYELQWGREKKLFERTKIMYPYKSSNNRFAIDKNNSYCSADVYSFYIKEKYKKMFSYEYVIGVLNSEIYNKYFKMIGKNMGNKIYDYYPNKVMKLKIFRDENYNEIELISKKIIDITTKLTQSKNSIKLQGKNNILNKEIYCLENESHFLQNKVNELIIQSLNL